VTADHFSLTFTFSIRQNDAIKISPSCRSRQVQFNVEDSEAILDVSVLPFTGRISSKSPKMVTSTDVPGETDC
jgi:hypothetical protein